MEARNNPMTDPKTLTSLSQTAEKSKKVAEDARKEYQNHLEEAQQKHPVHVKNIQDLFSELQRLEWERLCIVAKILETFVEQHEKLYSNLRATNKQIVAVVQGIDPQRDIQTFIERNRTDMGPVPDAVFEEWSPGLGGDEHAVSARDRHSSKRMSFFNVDKKMFSNFSTKKDAKGDPEKEKQKMLEKEKKKKEKDKKDKDKKDKRNDPNRQSSYVPANLPPGMALGAIAAGAIGKDGGSGTPRKDGGPATAGAPARTGGSQVLLRPPPPNGPPRRPPPPRDASAPSMSTNPRGRGGGIGPPPPTSLPPARSPSTTPVGPPPLTTAPPPPVAQRALGGQGAGRGVGSPRGAPTVIAPSLRGGAGGPPPRLTPPRSPTTAGREEERVPSPATLPRRGSGNGLVRNSSRGGSSGLAVPTSPLPTAPRRGGAGGPGAGPGPGQGPGPGAGPGPGGRGAPRGSLPPPGGRGGRGMPGPRGAPRGGVRGAPGAPGGRGRGGAAGPPPRPGAPVKKEPMLRALFEYVPDDGEEGVDLWLKQGEVVMLVQKVDDAWYKGRNMKGEEGIFPISFVEEMSVVRRCKVLHDYAAAADDELGLKQGETIIITEELEGWFQGCNLSGEPGMFPSTFVEMI